MLLRGHVCIDVRSQAVLLRIHKRNVPELGQNVMGVSDQGKRDRQALCCDLCRLGLYVCALYNDGP